MIGRLDGLKSQQYRSRSIPRKASLRRGGTHGEFYSASFGAWGFHFPTGLAFDEEGTAYVAESTTLQQKAREEAPFRRPVLRVEGDERIKGQTCREVSPTRPEQRKPPCRSPRRSDAFLGMDRRGTAEISVRRSGRSRKPLIHPCLEARPDRWSGSNSGGGISSRDYSCGCTCKSSARWPERYKRGPGRDARHAFASRTAHEERFDIGIETDVRHRYSSQMRSLNREKAAREPRVAANSLAKVAASGGSEMSVRNPSAEHGAGDGPDLNRRKEDVGAERFISVKL